MEIILNKNEMNIYYEYDYVTGGGTNITNKYYKDEFQKIKEFGIFWNIIYEEVEADVILV